MMRAMTKVDDEQIMTIMGDGQWMFPMSIDEGNGVMFD